MLGLEQSGNHMHVRVKKIFFFFKSSHVMCLRVHSEDDWMTQDACKSKWHQTQMSTTVCLPRPRLFFLQGGRGGFIITRDGWFTTSVLSALALAF